MRAGRQPCDRDPEQDQCQGQTERRDADCLPSDRGHRPVSEQQHPGGKPERIGQL